VLTTAVALLEISDIQAVVLSPRPSPYRGEYVILRVDSRSVGQLRGVLPFLFTVLSRRYE